MMRDETSRDAEATSNEQAENKLRILLIGIAGTSKDFLLSLPTLKSFVFKEEDTKQRVEIDIKHYKYILPKMLAESCGGIFDDIAVARSYDLVGFSTYVWNIDPVSRLVRIIKKRFPDTKIVLGGPEIAATDIIGGRFDSLPADFLVCGEGEVPFLGLVRHLLSPAEKRCKVSRLSWRRNGAFVRDGLADPKAGIVSDLASLPSPYLTGMVPDTLWSRQGMRANIETQRGCNFRCAYCLYHANFPAIRYRDADTVVKELEFISAKGVEEFRITDANFFSNKKFAMHILSQMIRNNFHMSFFVEVIPSFVDEEITALLGEYQALSPQNKILVGLGLQTVNEESLRSIKRRIHIKYFDRAYDLLSKANIVVKTDVILGLPHETKDTYYALMEYVGEKMRQGRNYLSLSVLRLLPGSELEKIARRENLVPDMRDANHFVYSTPDMPREDMIECLQISTAAYRLFHPLDVEGNSKLRKAYFRAKDDSGITHAVMMKHLRNFIRARLNDTRADYVSEDFANAEHYWEFDVHKDIPDDILTEELERVVREGITVPPGSDL